MVAFISLFFISSSCSYVFRRSYTFYNSTNLLSKVWRLVYGNMIREMPLPYLLRGYNGDINQILANKIWHAVEPSEGFAFQLKPMQSSKLQKAAC